MTKIYLITGFLGAGKTTVLKELAGLFPGEKLAVLVNDFGKEDVDGQLLYDMNAEKEEVHSGSIFCACRVEQFSHALSGLLERQPDRLIVETSGLSDPTRIRKILCDHPMSDVIEYRGCICIADAARFEKVYSTALVCGNQLDACDAVIINKTDIASEEQKKRTLELIYQRRPDVKVYETSFGRLRTQWLDALTVTAEIPCTPAFHVKDVSLHSREVAIRDTFPKEALLSFLGMIASASYRIKGFVRLGNAAYYVDAVGENISMLPWDGPTENPNRLVILAGKGLPLSSALERAVQDYHRYIISSD